MSNSGSEQTSVPADPKIGLVIGTFAASPYIHLHLESWKRNQLNVPLLVHDDSSHQNMRLRELCNNYNCEFTSTRSRRTHVMGDLSAILQGMLWAKQKKLDYVVKMSRRFIPLNNWLGGLRELITHSRHHTFSNITRSYGFGFRTECVGFCLDDWMQPEVFGDMCTSLVVNHELFMEGYIHDLARKLNILNKAAAQWDIDHNRPPEANAYAVWPFMGEDRCTRYEHFLWHLSHSPEEYARQARECQLPYSPADYSDPNQGGGDV